MDQWLRTIGVGALGIPMGVVIRLLPTVNLFPKKKGAPQHRWQKAIAQTQKQLSVVERFRRKVCFRVSHRSFRRCLFTSHS